MNIVELATKPTDAENVEATLVNIYTDHEEENFKSIVGIMQRQDGSFAYTHSHNLSSEQMIAMASFLQAVETLSFLGDSDES